MTTTTATVNYSRDQLETMSYGMLQQQAKLAGIKWVGVKKVKLIEDLLVLQPENEAEVEASVATVEEVIVTKDAIATTEQQFIYTTAPTEFDLAWTDTIEVLPLMNTKNRQWRKVKVADRSAQEAKYREEGYTFYDSDRFEAIRAYQLPFEEVKVTESVSATGKSKKEIFLAPGGEIKPAKPGSKIAKEIEILRYGATKEEVCEALSWKVWSYSRSSVLKLGYGIKRDNDNKFWLVVPEFR